MFDDRSDIVLERAEAVLDRAILSLLEVRDVHPPKQLKIEKEFKPGYA